MASWRAAVSSTSARGTRWLLLVPVAAAGIVALVASGFGWIALAVAAATAALWWSIQDLRAGFLIGIMLASFVNYRGGRLWIELGIVSAWLVWTTLLLLWRSAWKPSVRLPAGIAVPITVWAAACLFGTATGVLAGNSLRFLGIELSGALWPVTGVLMCQVLSRRNLKGAGWGLVAICLGHVVLGIVAIQRAHERLGGVYFTPLPGQVAVGLWAYALLAPRFKWRLASMALLVPLLLHQVLSFTRGYWLGILAGLAVTTILCWRDSTTREGRFVIARRAALWSSALVAILGVLLVSLTVFGRTSVLEAAGRRFGSSFSVQASGETASNIFRLLEYSQAVGAVRSTLIQGRGFGFTFMLLDPFVGSRSVDAVVHNYYLFILLKTGLVGLGAFLFLMWRLLRVSLSRLPDTSDWFARVWIIGAIAMTVEVLVISLTNYSLNTANTGAPFAFIWAGAWAVMGERDRARSS